MTQPVERICEFCQAGEHGQHDRAGRCTVRTFVAGALQACLCRAERPEPEPPGTVVWGAV